MTALVLSLLIPWVAGVVLCVLDGRRPWARWTGVVALVATLVALGALAGQVLQNGPVVITTGNWPAGVGITLLPLLAVKPPVPVSENIELVRFRNPPPSRKLALVWRRSSALSGFLHKLAATLRDLPDGLLDVPGVISAAPAKKTRAGKS